MTGVWWREGVLYQLYPRSFADSNGDGIGDLAGILGRLDYLAWLGVDGIWLNPTFPSPNADWGYDVADYCGVHPELGTLADLDRLVAAAGERGMRILLDLVPNHTSDRHPWFVESRSSRDSRRRDWYVWADPRADGSAPNGLRSTFGGPAWTLDERTGQYYLHSFLAEQPDLDWLNQDVRAEFERIVRFWLDRGIAGFRIDVVHRTVKPRRVRQAIPVSPTDPTPPADSDELHALLRRWRTLVDGNDRPGVLLGETHVLDVEQIVPFYGTGEDELHLAFNFPFVYASFATAQLSRVVAATESALPQTAWPVWTGSNHDAGRLATRWCRGDERKVRCALLILLALRGTPVLYYGDEIGLTDVDVPRDRLLDPVGIRGWPEKRGRDPCRTPMQWHAGAGAGFTEPGVEPWLPLGDAASRNVADQRDDPRSTLAFCRDLIALRRTWPSLRSAPYAPVDVPADAWAWRRGDDCLVAVNLGEREARLDGVSGTVAIGTTRERDGEAVAGVRLARSEGVVLRLEA